MNIYQKLIEVRKTVTYLQKDGKNTQYEYVSSPQTLGSLKAKMDELGLLLIPRILKAIVQDHVTTKDTLIKGEVVSLRSTHQYFTILDMLFTWVNAEKPEEKIKCRWHGQGLDFGEKGPGKAETYAEKTFMLKFFNIPTGEDDPDFFQNKIDGDNIKKNGEISRDNKTTQEKQEKDKVWPSKGAFIAEIRNFREKIGAEKYKEALKLHKVEDGEISKLNKAQGTSLYNDLMKAASSA